MTGRPTRWSSTAGSAYSPSAPRGADRGEFMRQALADKPVTDSRRRRRSPLGWRNLRRIGLLPSPVPTAGRSHPRDPFKSGTEPQKSARSNHAGSTLASLLQICLDSGQPAREHCPPERVVYKNYWVSTGMEIWDGTPCRRKSVKFTVRMSR